MSAVTLRNWFQHWKERPPSRSPNNGREMEMAETRRTTVIALALLASAALLAPSRAEEALKIGLLATFEGPFTVLGEDSKRGAELALKEHNGMAGGKKIEWGIGSPDASPARAVRAGRS